jgi:hypothetical protein
MAAFLELQSTLRRKSAAGDAAELDDLRLRTAHALDELQRTGAKVGTDQVDVRLIRPPWSSRKALLSAGGTASSFKEGVTESRAALIARRPHAANLLKYLDMRAEAVEPYRRLGEARHLAWADASVHATVAAVQRARETFGQAAPRVLIAEGSLGTEAAAAAAAGARVTVCEPNRFAASAIRQVAVAHGVGHSVAVVATTLEEWLLQRPSSSPSSSSPAPNGPHRECEVVVLAPLLEEAGLGKRLLPAAAAVARTAAAAVTTTAATATIASAATGTLLAPAIAVPARLDMYGALALLTAGSVHGVDLTPLDTTRWSAYPMPWAAHQEEGAALLSAYEPLFGFDLVAAVDPSGGQGRRSSSRSHAHAHPADRIEGCERRVSFVVTRELVAAANRTTGGTGGAEWARCNSLILDAAPGFDLSSGSGDATCAVLPPPPKRAVHFVEPFVVRPGQTVTLTVCHDGHRLALASPTISGSQAGAAQSAAAAAPLAPWGAADGWGRMLLQHWHFAMVRDMPRNDAYARAIAKAAPSVLKRSAAAQQAALRRGVRLDENIGAIDLGSGSGLLALMLAQAMAKGGGGGSGGGAGSVVLGVEIVAGVAELGRRVIAHNHADQTCSLIRAEGHQLCAQSAQRPPAERPLAPLLVAELMDSGGLGEGAWRDVCARGAAYRPA